VEADAAQVVKSSQISLHHCLLDGKPKAQHEGVAFLQISALPFADTRQVYSAELSAKVGENGSIYYALYVWPPLAGVFLHV